jgi:hypothetical protein
MNLIWTDLAASVSVGTRTGFEAQRESTESEVLSSALNATGYRSVYPYVRVIEYSDIRFAIPAFIVGGILAGGLITTIVLALCGTVCWQTLKHYINHTSMGRAITQITNPRGSQNVSTTEWLGGAGKTMLNIPGVDERIFEVDNRDHLAISTLSRSVAGIQNVPHSPLNLLEAGRDSSRELELRPDRSRPSAPRRSTY